MGCAVAGGPTAHILLPDVATRKPATAVVKRRAERAGTKAVAPLHVASILQSVPSSMAHSVDRFYQRMTGGKEDMKGD